VAYQIVYATHILRTLARLPKSDQARIVERVEMLALNQRPHGSIKLRGENAYRIRAGDYRILYTIADDQLIVLVIDIGHRRDVYRRR